MEQLVGSRKEARVYQRVLGKLEFTSTQGWSRRFSQVPNWDNTQ